MRRSIIKKEIERIISVFPKKESCILPTLQFIQKKEGYISKKSIKFIADILNINPISVFQLVTFYPMLKQKPIRNCHIKICRTVSCALKGSYIIYNFFKKKINKDKLVDIEFMECIANCNNAPVIQINGTLINKLSKIKIINIVDIIQKKIKIEKKFNFYNYEDIKSKIRNNLKNLE
jgi:NADH-quinone oxidoreductase subunit E